MVVLGDHVGIPALLQAMTGQGKRDENRNSVQEERQFEHHRAVGRQPGQPWHCLRSTAGAEELRMPGCVWIVNCHEHTAEVVPATFHTVFLPKPSEGTLGVG